MAGGWKARGALFRPSGLLRALVVKDGSDTRNYLREILDSLGYTTTAVATRSDGHEALYADAFDALIVGVPELTMTLPHLMRNG